MAQLASDVAWTTSREIPTRLADSHHTSQINPRKGGGRSKRSSCGQKSSGVRAIRSQHSDSERDHPAVFSTFQRILELRAFESPGKRLVPPPPFPDPPSRPGFSFMEIVSYDLKFFLAVKDCAQWWLDMWRVPLNTDYNAAEVTDFFLRRPHLVLFRTIQVAVSLGKASLYLAADTAEIQRIHQQSEAGAAGRRRNQRRNRKGMGFEGGEWEETAGSRREKEREEDEEAVMVERIAEIRRHSAERLKNSMVGLGPTFIKLAQSLSARPDVVGPEASQALSELQDRLPPFPTPEALALIHSELGQPADSLFPHMSAEPVAAASFGQVYRARTFDGQSVAVKVQRPNVLLDVARDVFILRTLLQLVRRIGRINSDIALLADEVGRGLIGELDYKKEAANARHFAKAHSHLPFVLVPRPLPHLSSIRVLTLEWIDGDKPSDLGRISQSDSPFAAPARQKLLRMVSLGVECSLCQLLSSGVMHADPHPGNILLTADGRLAYLDFGLLCHVIPRHRTAMLSALAHLMDAEWEQLSHDLEAMDMLKPGTEKGAVALALEESFGRAGPSPHHGSVSALPGMKFGQVANQLWKIALRFRFRLPPYYTLLLRSLVSLEGLGLSVDPGFKIFSSAYPFVVKQLLTDNSPATRRVLQELVLHADNNKLRWQRLTSLASISAQANSDAMASVATSGLNFSRKRKERADGTSASHANDQRADQRAADSSSSSSSSSSTRPGPEDTGSSSSGSSIFLPSSAGSLFTLFLSAEASSARRVVLESDLHSLAEAFVSPDATPSRLQLADLLSRALYSGRSAPVQAITEEEMAALGGLNSAGLIASTRKEDEWGSGYAGRGVLIGPLARRSGSASSPVGSFHGERQSEGKGRQKRFWWFLQAAFGKLEGGLVFRAQLLWTAATVLITALFIALRRLVKDVVAGLEADVGRWMEGAQKEVQEGSIEDVEYRWKGS